MKSGNRKGTWLSVLKDFVLVVVMVCAFRWAVAEPFLVPSGSMIPTLLIKDYIFVSKYSYGLRIPFTKVWLFGPRVPKRGDVVVFRSKDDNFYFMVKRVVGLPGDKIIVDRPGQRLVINGQEISMKQIESDDEDFDLYLEKLDSLEHSVQYSKSGLFTQEGEFEVGPKEIFMMGDNRDRSSDSRVWGALPLENILGRAQFIWMSCEEDSPAGGVLCFGQDLRKERLFRQIR